MILKTKMLIAGAGLPSLGGLKDYVVKEGGNLLTLVAVAFMVKFFISQDYGKAIFSLVIAGLIFFFIGSPDKVISAIKAVVELVIK
ncbi:TcpD family membrane protein [Carnobacterium divergens]|uniref:TcpD family membrane protein n=1 Tax=Carnobacterium divergens TaxID=2748 RepID=UPI0039AF7E65